MYYVYLLACADGSIYTGCSKNLKERFSRHNAGRVPATRNRLPVKLAFYCAFNDRFKAYAFEKYLKSGSGRAFSKRRVY